MGISELERSGAALETWSTQRPGVLIALEQLGLKPAQGFPKELLSPIQHPGSNAVYLMEYPLNENELILVQSLGPHQATSVHFHPEGVSEEFIPYEGTLLINGTPLTPLGRRVNLGEIHQATTRDNSALTIIVMQGIKGRTVSELHIRLDPVGSRAWLGKSAFDSEFGRIRDTLLLH